jgi:hypothetical protein
MIILTATCQNGTITLDDPLPLELEGKQIQIIVQEVPLANKRRQCGSVKGLVWMSDDFNEPLEEFEDYYR